MEKIVTSTNDEQYYHCCCCRNDWCWFHNPEKLTRSLSWLTEAHGADSPSSIWKTTRLHTPRVVMWVDYRVSTQNAVESLNGLIRHCCPKVHYLASVTGIMPLNSVITKLEKITTCFLLTSGHYTMTLSMKQDEKKSEAISSIDIKDHQHR